MKVFITGGTGFIGQQIARLLIERGDSVVVLSRSAERARGRLPAGATVVEGDPQYAGDWQAAVAGCDALVHLAGESVAGERWDSRFKQRINDSRVDSTMQVVEAIAAASESERPGVLVSASGADFYPTAEDLDAHTKAFEDDPVDESTAPGSSFLARVCRNWEQEAARAEEHQVRVVRMRTGLVLGKGGALDKLLTPFKLFVGGKIGSGQQWTSWIHVRDAARAYLFALDSELSGPVNVVAPGNVRNAELSKALGRAISRPSWMPVPGFALKAAVGEFAEYILRGRRVVPKALQDAGFQFEYPDIEAALGALEL
ncbi:MAG: TIGR01777 family oxidoreductase [Deltaproteobacteria bacterium]|nr:TIGR01777 family oxidoreductase [Deltaproteobacteria bacterium]